MPPYTDVLYGGEAEVWPPSAFAGSRIPLISAIRSTNSIVELFGYSTRKHSSSSWYFAVL